MASPTPPRRSRKLSPEIEHAFAVLRTRIARVQEQRRRHRAVVRRVKKRGV